MSENLRMCLQGMNETSYRLKCCVKVIAAVIDGANISVITSDHLYGIEDLVECIQRDLQGVIDCVEVDVEKAAKASN